MSYYFLNTEVLLNSWSVQKLVLSKGNLTLAKMSSKEALDNMRKITETPEDTTVYNFNLTRKQFRKFIKNDGFRKMETFYRVRQK